MIVVDEESHLYGKDYWNSHQAVLGLPSIETRARDDLAERCQYWLDYILRYCLPPARVLEVGCAHGGFVKLLNLAGFQACGLEMSPQIIAESRARFNVEIVQGPLEAASRSLDKFDLIALFDVLEHVIDPQATVAAIARHLADDGIVVIQTPRHDGIDDPNWPMFHPPDHTYLYSSQGLTRLLADHGLEHVAFEPPIFSTDAFVFASRRPMPRISREAIVRSLVDTPDGRVVLGMQDLYRKLRELRTADLTSQHSTRSLASALLRSLPPAISRRLSSLFRSSSKSRCVI